MSLMLFESVTMIIIIIIIIIIVAVMSMATSFAINKSDLYWFDRFCHSISYFNFDRCEY